MKILNIMAGAQHGGAETAFVDICLALHERGIDQVIVTRTHTPRVETLKKAGMKVYGVPFRGKVDIITPFVVRHILKKEKPDIIQSWMARAASVIPKKHGAAAHVARLGGYYNLKNFSSANFFVTNTPALKTWLCDQRVATDKVTVITNFATAPHTIPQIDRKNLNTPDDAFVVVALARYHPNKALDILIRAVEGFPNIHVWLAGEGPEREALQTLAKEMGAQERIHFLGWRDDAGALLAAADVCVFPSRQEPFGNVFIQAWAAKCPVISSRSEGPSYYMRDNEDGLLFPINDVGALQKCLSRVMNDKHLRDRLSANGFARFQNEFTKEKTVDAYEALYRRLLTTQ
jgi:glycosyltransferase involved in cell wall biosynthesis